MANVAQFVKENLPIAQIVGANIGVDPTVLLGQWGLETGWGKSVIPGTNNLGNIKDFSGGGVAATDNATGSRDKYRAYENPEAFGADFQSLLERRFKAAVGAGADAEKFGRGLQAGGYAEDPQYVQKLVAATNAVSQSGAAVDKLADDPLWQMLNQQSTAGAEGVSDKLAADPVWQMLNAPAAPAASAVTESRSPDGALRLTMGGTAPTPTKTGGEAFLEGVTQGAGDTYAGIAQANLHQGLQILRGIDDMFGTNLAERGARNVAQRDAEAAQREEQYQAATPDSFWAAGGGRLLGNIAGTAPGAAAFSAPVSALGSLGARSALAPGLAALGGRMAGGAGVGAGLGANAPVFAGDYDQVSAQNTGMGAVLGGVLPAAASAVRSGAGYAGGVARSLVEPFTQAGQQRIAGDILARMGRGGPMAGNGSQIVPGSAPTLAEATGNPGIAGLQRTMRDLNPTPFVEREQANAGARLEALGALRGTQDDLLAARAARDTQASADYLKTHVGIPVANTEYSALQKTPAFQSAFQQAEKMAKNAGGSVETQVLNRALANKGGSIGKPQTYVSGVGLHRIKEALDDQINTAAQAGEKGKAANILGVKDRLLSLMDREIPGYAEARGAYSSASREIDAMQYLQGMDILDAQGNATLAKVQSALRNLDKAQQKPGVNLAKSVTQDQKDMLTAIRDDLLRGTNVGLGRTVGSATAQNLAQQNMLARAIPGKLGAFAGMVPPGGVGSAVGAGLGFLAGGPAGAAAGGVVGNAAGKFTSAMLRNQNEGIQSALTQLLLDSPSGLAALQRASSAAAPGAQVGGLQRLLYPTLIPAGVGGATRLNAPRPEFVKGR